VRPPDIGGPVRQRVRVRLFSHVVSLTGISHSSELRALVTGDVLATENALTGRIGPQIMPDGLNEDGAQALASLDALLGIDADLILPGHGDPWTEGVAEAVRRAKAAGRS
jgi:glyoxylase-like metal-dependent hydrolase (beta-lactamase superfamily II)